MKNLMAAIVTGAAFMLYACGGDVEEPTCEESLADCYGYAYTGYMNSSGSLPQYVVFRSNMLKCQDLNQPCGDLPHSIRVEGVDLKVTVTSTVPRDN